MSTFHSGGQYKCGQRSTAERLNSGWYLEVDPTNQCGFLYPFGRVSFEPLTVSNLRNPYTPLTYGPRTIQESSVSITRNLESLLNGVEELPDELLSVGTSCQTWNQLLNVVTHHNCDIPKVIGCCSGELHGLTTRVVSLNRSSGMSLSRWNSATPYRRLCLR